MVQIISPSPRAMQQGQIGQALGIGINKNFPDPQQLVQKKMLSEAFQKMKQNNDPNQSPLDLTMSFLEATAGIPGSEKYVGQVLPLLLQKSRGDRGAGLDSPNGNQISQPITNQSQESNNQQVPNRNSPINNSNQFLQQTSQEIPNFPQPEQEQQNLFEGSLEPTQLGMGALPNVYSPQQIQQLETQDLQSGFPDMPRAARAKEYNEMARKELQDYTNAATTQSNIANQRREAQNQFRTTLGNFVGKDPLDLALAENIAETKYRNISNDQIRADKVSKEYDLVKANLNEFRNSSSRPNPYLPFTKDKYNNSFKTLSDNAKPLVNLGMRPQLTELLSKNGWSMTETDQILNPLGQKIISEVKTLPNLERSSVDFQQGSLFPSETMNKASQNENQRMQKNENTWADYFKKAIKPGVENPKSMDVLKPGTSLLLMQDQFMKKGGNYLQFQNIINDLVRNGDLKLDKYQQLEMNKLNTYPIKNKTIEEFFFGTKNL